MKLKKNKNEFHYNIVQLFVLHQMIKGKQNWQFKLVVCESHQNTKHTFKTIH